MGGRRRKKWVDARQEVEEEQGKGKKRGKGRGCDGV